MSLIRRDEMYNPAYDASADVWGYGAKITPGNLEDKQMFDEHCAIIAANINILRRNTPFAFLLIDSHNTYDDWLRTWRITGGDYDDEYILSLPHITIPSSRTSFYGVPEASAIIIAIGTGDVMPFIPIMELDNLMLLCLPSDISLTDFEGIYESDPSEEVMVDRLLNLGGIIIQMIDGQTFNVKSRKPLDERIFQ